MQATRPGPAAPRLLSTAYLLAALAFAGAVSLLWLGQHLSVPQQDDWLLLDQMYRSPIGSWIFSPQNGHRLPVTLLLLYVDQTFAGGRMHLLVVASLASAWVSALVLSLVLRGPAAYDTWLRRAMLGFGIFGLFWSGSVYNFAWGVNQGSVWTAMWLLVAFSALAAARRPRREHGEGALLLLAVTAAFLASYGHGIGIAGWPALFAIWAAARMPARVAAALAAGALVCLGLYSIGLFGSGGAPPGAGALIAPLLAGPLDLLLFVCAFIGAPFAWALHGLGLVAADRMLAPATATGALLTLAGAVLGRQVWRRGAALPDFALVGLGLMVSVWVAGWMVGITRLSHYGPQQAVDLRFLCFSTLLWIGAPLALGGFVSRRSASGALAGALALLSVAMLPLFFEIRARQREAEARLADTALGLLAGARPESLPLEGLWKSTEAVGRVSERLARERRSPFDDERSGLAGTAFTERFAVAGQAVCGDAVELRWWTRGSDLALVRGRLAADGPDLAYLVVVDSKGVIRGLGEERSSPRGEARGRRWEGVIAGFAPGEPYAAWAVRGDRRSACPAGVIGAGPGANAPGGTLLR